MKSTGLTLVEVLLSLVIIAVTFAVLASSQISHLQVTRDSAETVVATTLMLEKYEEAKAQILYVDRGDPNNADDDVYNFFSYVDCPTESYSNPKSCSYSGTAEGGYNYVVTITGLAGSTDPRDEGIIQIDVSVSGPSSLALTAYASCYDVYPSPKVGKPDPCPNVTGT